MIRILFVVFVVFLVGGCAAGAEPAARFPHHRHDHDQKLQQLETTVTQQAELISTLTQRIAKLEQRVGGRADPPAGP